MCRNFKLQLLWTKLLQHHGGVLLPNSIPKAEAICAVSFSPAADDACFDGDLTRSDHVDLLFFLRFLVNVDKFCAMLGTVPFIS